MTRCELCAAPADSECPAASHPRYCDLVRMEASGEKPGRYYTEFVGGGASPGATPTAATAATMAEEPALPSIFRQGWNFAKAAVAHVADGMQKADEATVMARLSACGGCDMLRAGDRRCSAMSCGCYVDEKATWASESCPLGKWPANGAIGGDPT